jgi:hypothetical protein
MRLSRYDDGRADLVSRRRHFAAEARGSHVLFFRLNIEGAPAAAFRMLLRAAECGNIRNTFMNDGVVG